METKIKHLKQQSLSGKTITDYVECLSVFEKDEFLNDTISIVDELKVSYKRVLFIHLIFTLFVALTFINLQLNFTGLSAIFFILSFSVFSAVSFELYKSWKRVRIFKLLKKLIQKSKFGYPLKDSDDIEFFPFK